MNPESRRTDYQARRSHHLDRQMQPKACQPKVLMKNSYFPPPPPRNCWGVFAQGISWPEQWAAHLQTLIQKKAEVLLYSSISGRNTPWSGLGVGFGSGRRRFIALVRWAFKCEHGFVGSCGRLGSGGRRNLRRYRTH